MRHVILAAAVAALAAAPLAAQQPSARDTARHPMMGGRMAGQRMAGGMGGQAGGMGCSMMGGMMHDSAMGGMMEAMMREMALAPEHLLARKAALGLTADQERRLTAIRDAARRAHDAGMSAAMRHQQEIDAVMRAAAPDTAAVTHHFTGAHAAMGQAHLAMLQSAALARAVLTDAQRRQADSVATAMGCGAMSGMPAGAAAHDH